MLNWNRCAKINVKVLIIVVLITVALGASLLAARQVRRSLLSKMALDAGQAAYESKDWPEAYKQFREYLGRNPDDVEILKKYAKARLSIRPVDIDSILGTISAYRRVIQLDPQDETAYDELARLYAGIGNFEELAYIARKRLDLIPEERKGRLDLVENDRKAHLWLGEALIRLRKKDEARAKLEPFITELEKLPDKYDEYVRACALMSAIEIDDDSRGAEDRALEWLNKAADHAPESVETLVHRARFYRGTPDINDMTEETMLAAARRDIEKADGLGTDNPLLRLSLCAEWIAHNDLDRAAAELKAVDHLTQEELEKHFLDINDWTVSRFILAAELARLKGATAEGATLVDEVLLTLEEKRHRIQVLPLSVGLYVATGRVPEARKCLDEYLDTMYTQEGVTVDKMMLAYLQALVARAEERPYVVIDVLQPATVSDAARPEIWRLLAEAYSRTDQARRAVSALIQYLRMYPRDPQMTLQLAREYLKLRDWNRAFEAARLAEPLDPTNIVISLLLLEASIYLAAEQEYTVNEAKLKALETELADLRKNHPERVDIRILQAIIAVYLENPDKAEKELKDAIVECDEPLRAEMQLARHYYRTKRMPEAIAICRTACEDHAEVAEPWLSLAGLYVSDANHVQALSCLRQGLEKTVGKYEKRSLSMRLALVELLHGDRAKGISLLSEIAAQDKQEIRARSLLLGLREIQEDQEKADRLIEELKAAEGENGLMWRLSQASLWLASDNWRSKQPDITDLLQRCIDSDPQWSQPVLLLVNMYEKLEDFKRVEDTCRQALVRNPSATDVADRLMDRLEKERRFSEAEKVVQQVEANPRAASAWRVGIALNAKDFSRAIDELKLRASNDDRDASSRILLARLVYWQTKDAEQAFAHLKDAEDIVGNSMALTAAKVSILRAEGEGEEAGQILNDYVTKSDDFGSRMMRAAYFANEGELERAEEDYKKLTTDPEQGAIGYELLSNFYGRNGKIDKAAATLEEGLKAHPANLSLKRKLMKTLFLRGQAEDKARAADILATLAEQLPHDPELMKFQAVLMLEEPTPESLKTARAKLENAVKLEPTAVDTHLALIGVVMQQGEYETARDLAIRAVATNPDNSALLSARGRAELALENTKMAAELAQMALKQDPNSVAARDLLAAAAVRLTDSNLDKTAIEWTHRTLEEDPNNAAAQSAIVALAMKTGDRTLLEEARTLIDSALASNPTNEQILLSRTRILVSLELHQAAIPELETYCQTEAGRSSIAAIVTLADLYRLSGDMDQAQKKIERAEQVDPTSQTVIHSRFLWLVVQKRFDELAKISSAYISAKDEEQNVTTVMAAATVLASLDSMELKKEGIKLFEHAASLSPTLLAARLGLATTLYQTGDVERAKKVYEEALEQAPYNAQILNDLAWILREDDKNAALELANKGLSIDRADADLRHLLDTRGVILFEMERFADARRDFERLEEISPDGTRQRAKALLQLGRTCAKLNDLAKAAEHLNEALDIDRKLDVFTVDERSEITKIIKNSGFQAVNR